MKISDIIREHNKVPDQTFPKQVLDDTASKIGNIRLKNGNFADVFKKQENNVVQLLAVVDNQVVGFITLVIIPNRNNIAMVKNAEAYLERQGISLNLIMFSKYKLGLRLISDYEMTDAGELTWQGMASRPQLRVKIYNFDQDKVYNLDDPGVVKPEDDQNYNNIDEINWFYIIESNNKFGIKYNKILEQYYYEMDD